MRPDLSYHYNMVRWLLAFAVVAALLGSLWTASCDVRLGNETASGPCHYSSASPLATGLLVSLMVGLPALAAFYSRPKSLVLRPVPLEAEAPRTASAPPPPPPPRWY